MRGQKGRTVINFWVSPDISVTRACVTAVRRRFAELEGAQELLVEVLEHFEREKVGALRRTVIE
jgi:hypothetical protein